MTEMDWLALPLVLLIGTIVVGLPVTFVLAMIECLRRRRWQEVGVPGDNRRGKEIPTVRRRGRGGQK